jgi:hypothetical protein
MIDSVMLPSVVWLTFRPSAMCIGCLKCIFLMKDPGLRCSMPGTEPWRCWAALGKLPDGPRDAVVLHPPGGVPHRERELRSWRGAVRSRAAGQHRGHLPVAPRTSGLLQR